MRRQHSIIVGSNCGAGLARMRIFVLTGAGISAESGLGTFRDTDGLWTRYDLNDVATPEGFARNPELVHEFYNARRANCVSASPNAAHKALARLQKDKRFDVTLVTQNVDDLHERAGSDDVIHMHGQLMQALCAACNHRWDAPLVMARSDLCPACHAPRTRPDVVWFGEMPYALDLIDAALSRADIFAAIGTSGTVYPAAGMVDVARSLGIQTVEINLEPSGAVFHSQLLGAASDVVPRWVDDLCR